MNGESNGPQHLDKLWGYLRNYVRAKRQGRRFRSGNPAPSTKPRKLCKICGIAFDLISVVDAPPMELSICDGCQMMLDHGLIAFVCGKRYAFGSSPVLEDMKGQIVQVTEQTMDEIQREQSRKSDE